MPQIRHQRMIRLKPKQKTKNKINANTKSIECFLSLALIKVK